MALNLGTAYSSIEVRLDKLEAGLAQAQRDFGNAGRRLEGEADKIKRNLTQSFGEVGRMLSLSVTAPLAALGTAAIRAATDMDSLKRGLTAVTGNAEETNRQLVRLREVAKLPGLGFREAIQGSINLQAAGFSARDAERHLKAFGNALATVGKGKAELDLVNLALTQLANKTSGFGQEIRQLQEQLPQVRKIMIEAFGTADSEIIANAGITGKQFVDIISSHFAKLPAVLGGAKNSFENFSDSAGQALAKIGDVFLPSVTKALDAINPMLEKVASAFSALPGPAQDALGALAIGGALMGPALLGLGALANAIKNVRDAWVALKASGWLGIVPKAGPVAALAAGAAAYGNMLREGFTNTEKFGANTATAMGMMGTPGSQGFARLSEQIGSRNQVAKVIPPSIGELRRLEGATGAAAQTNITLDVAKMAEEARKRKEAAKEAERQAKQFAKDQVEALRQYEADMAGFRSRFAKMRVEADQQFQKDLPLLGRDRATNILRGTRAQIDKEEADEKQRLAEAHQRKLEEMKRRNDAELSKWIELGAQRANSITVLSKDETRILINAQREQFSQVEAYREKLSNAAKQSAADRIEKQIAAEVEAMREAAQKRIDEMERQSEAYQAAVDLYSKQKPVGIDPNKPRAIPEVDNPLARPETKDQYAARIQRINNSLRRSLGGTLGMEIGYAFSDGFAQSIEKALGGGSVGKVIARAFARWMDKEITNLLDNLFDQLAKKKGAAGGAGAGGGGGIFGTILSGLGLGMALGGLFKGFKLKFAEGGIVPGPIGQPQPAIVHSGEVVLNQRQQAALLNGMGGGGMNLHIENAHFASDYDVDRMWDRFNWNMKNRRAVNPGVG